MKMQELQEFGKKMFRGPSAQRLKSDGVGVQIGIIQISNLSNPNIANTLGIEFENLDSEKVKEYLLEPNDVLLSLIGTPLKVSRVAINDTQLIAGPNVAVLRPEQEVSSEYLVTVLRLDFIQIAITEFLRATTIANIPMNELKTLKVPIPTKEIQASIAEASRAFQNYANETQALVQNQRIELEATIQEWVNYHG